MANITTFLLPTEQQITLTFDAFSSGHFVNIGNPGDTPTEFTAVTASDVVVLGPFNTAKNYRVNLLSGSYTSAQSFLGVDLDSDLGTMSTQDADAVAITGGTATFDQTGLKLKGATANTVQIKSNETHAANRTLNLVMGASDRSVTLSADVTIGGTHSGTSSGNNTGDQDLSDYPTEAELTTTLSDYVTESALTTALADYEPLIVAGTFIASPTAIAENDLKDAIDDIRDLLIAKGIMAAS